MKRCPWVKLENDLYVQYHDEEWGVPVFDDRKQFEFLILEGFQAGLSWETILKKRENFRKAFDNFDPYKIAQYDDKKFEELMNNEGIIRNRLKIQATITNATLFVEMMDKGESFSELLWGFVDGKPIVNKIKTHADYQATSPESDAMSKELKKRGFKFVGSTICYAHMQATGMVNDHSVDCFRYKSLS